MRRPILAKWATFDETPIDPNARPPCVIVQAKRQRSSRSATRWVSWDAWRSSLGPFPPECPLRHELEKAR